MKEEKPILLIEDGDDLRESMAELLRARNYPVGAVCHGQQALDQLNAGLVPCLIVLDLMMPVMNGWEFRQRQLSEPQWASIPTVVMTGVADPQRQAANLSAVTFLSKPLDFDNLYEMLEKYC